MPGSATPGPAPLAGPSPPTPADRVRERPGQARAGPPRRRRDRQAMIDWMRQAFEDAPGFVAAWRGADSEFVVANASYRRLVGDRALIGVPIRDAFPEVAGQGFFELLEAVRAGGERRVVREARYRLHDAPGAEPREVVVDFTLHPLRDETGAIWGALMIGDDATARHALTQRLVEGERRLNGVLNNASVAIFVMDARQHCTYMNPAAEQLTGWTLAETRGRPLHDVVHHTRPDGSPYPLEECPIDRAFPENNQERGEEVFVHRDGSFYPLAFTASPLRDERGTTVGTVIEVRDIRAERAALEALREADRRKDEFIATLAHELRNPLAPLANALALLERTRGADARERAALAIAGRQARQLARLVDDLLDVSRITCGMVLLRRETVDVREVVGRAIESAAATYGPRRQTIAARLPDAPVLAEVDPARLTQVLENLLSNAGKFNAEGGTVEVSLDAGDDAFTVRVRDRGIGIARESLDRLFELFVQLDVTDDRARGGLGIGLALVRQLVALHGGSVRADSAGPGTGATFTVEVPRRTPPAADAAPRGTPAFVDAPTHAVDRLQ